MNPRRWLPASIALVLLGYSACAFPDFQYLEEDDENAGSGGNPSVGGSSHAGMGGSGGELPVCELGVVGSCGNGQKCSVVDLTTGAVDCVVAGPREAFSRCGADVECVEGTYCDATLQVCKPLCQSGNDCAPGAQCYEVLNASMQPVPGLKLCTAHCHPETGAECKETNGPVTCYYDVARTEFDCARSLNYGDLDPCSSPFDCGKGFACVGPQGNQHCLPWCTPVNGVCLTIFLCEGLSPSISYNGTEYGVCG